MYFCFIKDDDGHWYLVPEQQRSAIYTILDAISNDEDSSCEDVDKYRINSPTDYLFTNPVNPFLGDYTPISSHDFLDRPVREGDNVVGVVYGGTSAMLHRGVVIKVSPKTVLVKLENGKERRFDFSKIVKV